MLHNMGLGEDWLGEDSRPEMTPKEHAEHQEMMLRSKKLQEAFQADLDSKASLSLAHKGQAEFDGCCAPQDAVALCSNGMVTLSVKQMADSSVLIFIDGEMGIEDIKAFVTLTDAKVWVDQLEGFDAL